jgi:F-type H+-transporting ATPase subunit b
VIELPPDYTFVIQLVSFVVFWQLLRVILIVPMQQVLHSRAERTTGARARAEALLVEAAQVEMAVETGLADARRQGARDAEEIRRRAEAEEQAVLARYRAEAATLLERERAATEAQVIAARAPLETGAAQLADTVVTRVLGRAA